VFVTKLLFNRIIRDLYNYRHRQLTIMYENKTTESVKTRKGNIGSFLTILFCTFVVTGTIGSSVAISNSFAQEQQIQQAPTIAYKSPWSNNLQISSTGSQPLCVAGVCSQSANPASTIQSKNVTTQLSSQDPPKVTIFKNTFTNTKALNLNHKFVSNKVVGPDRFRFIGYYWTSSSTPRAVDVGTSAGFTALSALPQPPNVQQEVDTNEGQNTLAIQLQYQGVVPLSGITAALKLPTGFQASIPLTSDRNRWDIALSQYRGTILSGQGIALYFTVDVLPNAKVGLPVLAPVALHFLRSDQRSISDSLEGAPENAFVKALTITNGANSTTFNGNFDFKRDYYNQFDRLIPYDFVNQVIPVIFKVTGQETLDVVTLPLGQPGVNTISTDLLALPNGKASLVRLAVTNTGDAPIWDLTVNVFPGLQSALGINGLNPALITSPDIPATLFSTILPIGIAGHSYFYLGYIPPGGLKEFDVRVFPTHYVAGTVELMNANLVYNNVVGSRATQLNQVYFNITPNP
jgi:hypothetical protein